MQISLTTQRERRWAIARLILGLLQMAGAGFSLALLIEGGVTKLSLIAVAITGILTTASVLLFGSWRQSSGQTQLERRK